MDALLNCPRCQWPLPPDESEPEKPVLLPNLYPPLLIRIFPDRGNRLNLCARVFDTATRGITDVGRPSRFADGRVDSTVGPRDGAAGSEGTSDNARLTLSPQTVSYALRAPAHVAIP